MCQRLVLPGQLLEVLKNILKTLLCREMSKDGEFLASSGAGFGPSPTTAILETQVGVPTSSESDVFPSVVQDRVPPRGPGTTIDMDSTLLRGNQGSLAPNFPVSVSADSTTSTPGGSRRHSGSAARGTDRHSSTGIKALYIIAQPSYSMPLEWFQQSENRRGGKLFKLTNNIKYITSLYDGCETSTLFEKSFSYRNC